MILTKKRVVDIIDAYTIDLIPIAQLANQYGVTRQAIYKALKLQGIDTSKAVNGKIIVSCACCGAQIKRHRSKIRRSKYLFCDIECYYAYIEGKQQGEYNGNRHGQRLSRVIVSQYFDLKPEHIVHHEDRNTHNRHPKNLKVFANQGDHIRHHRWSKSGIEIKPLWDGALM